MKMKKNEEKNGEKNEEKKVKGKKKGKKQSRSQYTSHTNLSSSSSNRLDILADPQGGLYAKPLIRQLANLPFPSDPAYQRPGTKVMHIPDLDINTICTTLLDCLRVIKTWMDAHPKALPLSIVTEFKEASSLGAALGGAKAVSWDNATLLDGLDADIRSVFGPKQLITPDEVRRPGHTLEESVLKYGWPDLDSARGRVFFLMDNGRDDAVNEKYREGKTNLEGRVLFTNSAPGNPDCAFQKVSLVMLPSLPPSFFFFPFLSLSLFVRRI